jgi:transglutaminase-like putative cysteine protease
MKSTILACFFIGSLLTAHAQETTVKFGEPNPAELKMTNYERDTSASAVVLYDFGETNFLIRGREINMVFVYHARIKILKKSALDEASIEVPFSYSGRELVSDIKGFTYNLENGQVVKEKLTKDMIFHEKSSEEIHTMKFTLPKAKEGSVVEFKYEISTPFSHSYTPRTWSFQGSHPVAWSEYRITIPDMFYYKMVMSGYLPLTVNELKEEKIYFNSDQYSARRYRFAIDHVPAFRSESYITTPGDYISKILFELSSVDWPGVMKKSFSLDWADLNKTLLESPYLGEVIKRDNFLKKTADELLAKSPDTLARIENACQYLANQIKWNERTSFQCKNMKKIFEDREGDSGDINLILVALLRQMGLDANPVILSTRSHGRIDKSYGMLKHFNNVLAHVTVGGKEMLLDATDKNLKPGVVPTYCLNYLGFLIHPTAPRFIEINSMEYDREQEKFDLKISPDGELSGKLIKWYNGYSGWSARTAFQNKGKDRFLEEIKKSKTSWTVQQAEYKNTNTYNIPMEASYDLSLSDYVTAAGNLMYLKPMLSEGLTENPFKAEERVYPVDFNYPIEETVTLSFELPAGYTVAEMPKSASVSLPDNGGRFLYTIQHSGNKVNIMSRFTIRKAKFGASEYSFIREFFAAIVAKHGEQIVLKKI